MQDLNDLVFFAHVVEHGGFIRAANTLGMPKSTLSKRVARLERDLEVLLIDRSTRRFRVTEAGNEVYSRCRDIVDNIAAAEALVAEMQGTPRGLLRVSSPPGLCEKGLATIIPSVMRALPRVRIQVIVSNDRIDLIDKRIDVALRVRQKLDTDANLKMRTLGQSKQLLVASPSFLASLSAPLTIQQIEALPTLTMNESSERDVWELFAHDGTKHSVRHTPQLACSDFHVLLEAASAGLGIALLPGERCLNHLKSGALVQVLPEWHAVGGIIHVVFKATKGIPPAVRFLIDSIVRDMPQALATLQAGDPGASVLPVGD